MFAVEDVLTAIAWLIASLALLIAVSRRGRVRASGQWGADKKANVELTDRARRRRRQAADDDDDCKDDTP